MPVVGADATELRSLARLFEREARTLSGLAKTTTSLCMNSCWSGTDADGFRDEWNRAHVRAIGSVSGSLLELAGRLSTQADEQERASSEDSGASLAIDFCYATNQDAAGQGPIDGDLLESLKLLVDMQDYAALARLMNSAENMTELRALLAAGKVPGDLIPWLGLAVGGASFAYAVQEHGWYSEEAQEELARAIGGEVVGYYAPVLGPLVWDEAFDAFLWAKDGAGDLGAAAGEGFVSWSNDRFNSFTSSDEGVAAGSWLKFEYGVTDFDDLPPHLEAEARQAYRDHLESAGGMYETVLGVGVRTLWWAMKGPFD